MTFFQAGVLPTCCARLGTECRRFWKDHSLRQSAGNLELLMTPHATTAGERLSLEPIPNGSIRLQAALQAAPAPRSYDSRDMRCGESTSWQKSLMTFVIIFMPAAALCGTCISPVDTAGMLHFLDPTNFLPANACCFQDGGHCITGYEVLVLHSVLSCLCHSAIHAWQLC